MMPNHAVAKSSSATLVWSLPNIFIIRNDILYLYITDVQYISVLGEEQKFTRTGGQHFILSARVSSYPNELKKVAVDLHKLLVNQWQVFHRFYFFLFVTISFYPYNAYS